MKILSILEPESLSFRSSAKSWQVIPSRGKALYLGLIFGRLGLGEYELEYPHDHGNQKLYAEDLEESGKIVPGDEQVDAYDHENASNDYKRRGKASHDGA